MTGNIIYNNVLWQTQNPTLVNYTVSTDINRQKSEFFGFIFSIHLYAALSLICNRAINIYAKMKFHKYHTLRSYVCL